MQWYNKTHVTMRVPCVNMWVRSRMRHGSGTRCTSKFPRRPLLCTNSTLRNLETLLANILGAPSIPPKSLHALNQDHTEATACVSFYQPDGRRRRL